MLFIIITGVCVGGGHIMEWEELPGRKNAFEHLQFQLKGVHDLLTSQRNWPLAHRKPI